MITTENSIRTYHSSDSRPFSGMKKIEEKNKPDIAFCNIGIAPKASPRSEAKEAKLIQPKAGESPAGICSYLKEGSTSDHG